MAAVTREPQRRAPFPIGQHGARAHRQQQAQRLLVVGDRRDRHRIVRIGVERTGVGTGLDQRA